MATVLVKVPKKVLNREASKAATKGPKMGLETEGATAWL
jgi:hypothetical protein